MTDTAVRGLITRRALAGDSLEAIEREVIESHDGLGEEERAALWLYARHHTENPGRSERASQIRDRLSSEGEG